MRVAVLAPTDRSLYARLVAWRLAHEPGLTLAAVLVRSIWSPRRLRQELRRDGARLLDKIYRKLLLGERAYAAEDPETLRAAARQAALPRSGLAALARALGAPAQRAFDLNAPAAVAALQAAAPDAIAFTGGGLVREPLLSLARHGVLNCHMGLLPRYRGMDVVEWPLLEAGAAPPAIGLTLHVMDRGVDTGPLLLQRRIAPRPGDSLESLRRRFEPAMVELMLEGLRGLRDGALTRRPQDPAAGRQYYVMHPRLRRIAAQRLAQRYP
jgi:methionyl-tRNA formyltransferase